MNITEIAQRLVQLCREGKNTEAKKELYADDITSMEADGKITNGIEAILKKGQDWHDQLEEIHDARVSDPIVAEHHFAISMFVDATYKGGFHNVLNEICIYEVRNGKIISEKFFFTA